MSIELYRRLGLGALTAASVSLLSGSALAYTPEQQQACSDDAMRLCGNYVPDVDRITACMIQRKQYLSPACRAQFGPPDQEAQGRPADIRSHRHKPRRRDDD